MRNPTIPLVVACLVLFSGTLAAQQPQPGTANGPLATVDADALQWQPVQPPGWTPGVQMSVVRGNPSEANAPYVLRLRLPDGYRFPPHYHPVAENVTVLSGTFRLAMGERADQSQLRTYQPGDYLFIDARHPHYGGVQGDTVIQLHGMGPFEIITVGSPEDQRM